MGTLLMSVPSRPGSVLAMPHKQTSTAAGFITKHGESKHFPLTFALPLRTDVASLPFNGVNAMKYYNGS